MIYHNIIYLNKINSLKVNKENLQIYIKMKSIKILIKKILIFKERIKHNIIVYKSIRILNNYQYKNHF